MTTSARKPPGKPSDEADRHQIAMAKKEGAAYHASFKYMAEEVADSGGMKHAGDYIVAYAQERAEGIYMLKGEGELDWDAPTDENCPLEISVSDAGDQRFIPYLEITITLTSEKGKAVGPFEVRISRCRAMVTTVSTSRSSHRPSCGMTRSTESAMQKP